jgi:hypothetical protein
MDSPAQVKLCIEVNRVFSFSQASEIGCPFKMMQHRPWKAYL